MKFQIAVAFVALALALTAGAQVTGPGAAAVSQGAFFIPTVTGPVYEAAPQNTPPPADQGTASGTSSAPSSAAPSYAPVYERNTATDSAPPQDTPPPTTPGENP